jgi:8-oxo-dGTP pyrophosphatase MutT (NUDIX family)
MKKLQFKCLLGLVVLLALLQTNAASAVGAGVLVSTVHNGQVYVLLADHKKTSQFSRGWSTLGGTVKRGESLLQAAVREVVEESNGGLSSELLLSAIDPDIKTVTPGFTIFYAQIPYQSIETFNLKEGIKDKTACIERGPFIWLPWQEILTAANTYRTKKQQTEKHNSNQLKVNLNKKYLVEQSQTDWFFNAFLETIEGISQTPQTYLSSAIYNG